MSVLCVVRSGGSKHPRITWTCDSCGTTETLVVNGWDGPAQWITRLTPSGRVRNLCGLCAATNERAPVRFCPPAGHNACPPVQVTSTEYERLAKMLVAPTPLSSRRPVIAPDDEDAMTYDAADA